MTADEKREILAKLDRGRKALGDAVDGVTAEVAVRPPGPGRWSILECVEHIANSEDHLYGQICEATASAEPVINAKREALIQARGTDRSQRYEAPPVSQPKGRFSTLPAALEHFIESRERTIAFVQGNREDLRARLTTHPILGTLNCYETLLLMAEHPLRHVQQIEEIKSAVG
jgi:hypothetical protein